MATTKAPPLDRKVLRQQSVTRVDPFTALRYMRRREETPRVAELEKQGQGVLPSPEAALLDLFNVLWEAEPVPRPEDEIPPAQRYWQTLLGRAMGTSAYHEMHATTAFSELYSLLGAITMGDQVLTMVPKEDQKKLQEMQRADQRVQEERQSAGEAQQRAGVMAMLAQVAEDAAQEAAAAAISAAGTPTQELAQAQAAQAQVRAESLQQQAQEAQAQAEAAGMSLEEAKALVQQQAEGLMGEPGSGVAQAKETELARLAQSALQKSLEQVQETSSTLQGWGAQPGELQEMTLPEVLEIAKELRQSDDFEEWAKLLGALLRVAEAKHERNQAGQRRRKVTFGRDFRRAHPAERAMLAVPFLRYRVYLKWARGKLRQVGSERLAPVGKGPILYLEDGSGSMEGPKRRCAKATGIALAYYCELEGRDFAWVHFGADQSPTTVRVYPRGRLNLKQKLEFRRTFLNAGGTSFERALKEAMAVVRGEKPNLPPVELEGKAEIVLGSDGISVVRDELLTEYLAFKKQAEVSHVTVLMDVGQHTNASVEEFSDMVEKLSQLTAGEVKQKIFDHLV